MGNILSPDEAPFRIQEKMLGYSTVTILVAPASSVPGFWGGTSRRGGWPACAPPPGSTNDITAVEVSVRCLTDRYVSFPMNPYRNTVKDLFDLYQDREGLTRHCDLVYRGTRLGRREYNLIDYGIGDGSGDDGGRGTTGPARAISAASTASTTTTATTATTTTSNTYCVHVVLRMPEFGTGSSDRATVRRARRLTAHLAHLPVVLYPRALAKIGRERHALFYALHHLLPPEHMVAPAVDDRSATSDETNKPTTQVVENTIRSFEEERGIQCFSSQVT